MMDRPEDDAFRLLYEKYYSQVYYVAYSIVKDRFLAQDVAQETFLKVHRHFHAIDERNNLAAWIKKICRNTALDFQRHKRMKMEISDERVDIHAGASENEIERYIHRHAIDELMTALEPSARETLLLVCEEGVTYEQLAALKDTSVGSVKSMLHRTRKKLRSIARKMDAFG